jgi:NitT/TauT family transport system substrate-binding protein
MEFRSERFAERNNGMLVVDVRQMLQGGHTVVLALMAAPNAKITSLAQIKGKTVPVSGIHDIANLLIDSVLVDNDIPTDSVHYVPNVPLPEVPAEIAKGVFATGPVSEPYVSTGEQQQGDVVLAHLDQGATSDFPILGFTVTQQWAQKHPNTLKAFATALASPNVSALGSTFD